MKRILLASASVLVAIIAQSRLDWLIPVNSHPGEAAILYGIAVLLFLLAVRGGNEPFNVGIRRPESRRLLLYAALASAAVGIVCALLAVPRFVTAEPADGGWLLHGISIAAILLGALLLHLAQRPPDAPSPVPSSAAPPAAPPAALSWLRANWQPMLALLALMAIGAFFRLRDLEMLPEGIWYDEAVNALIARDILARPDYRPFYLETTFHTAHHNYLVALAFWLFGESIASARLVSAIMGILLIPAGWLLAWEFFQTRPSHGRARSAVPMTMAFSMAALMTFLPWSLNFSRIAVNYIATPLFVMLATAFLLRGLRTQSMLSYAASGFALAAGLMFYTSFRVFAPVLPFFVLAVLVTRGRGWQAAWRDSWRGLVTLSLVTLIVAAPLASFGLNNRSEFMERAQDVSLFKDKDPAERGELLLENVRKHLLMFNVAGDGNGRHNLPGRPMLDPWLSALFVLGVALSIWRWRHPLHLLLLVWMACTLLGGILSLDFEAPHSLRSNGAMPAATLLALLPIAALLRMWERNEAGKYFPRLAPALALAALMPLLIWNWHAFFRVQVRDFAVWNSFSTGETLIAREIAALSPDSNDVWIMSNFQRQGDVHPSSRFLAPQWIGSTKTLHAWESMPYVWTPGKAAWLYFDFDTLLPFETLKSLYPAGDYREMAPPFSQSVAGYRAHISAEIAEASRGLEVRWLNANDDVIGRTRVADLATLPTEMPPDATAIEYAGVLRISEFGDYRIALESAAPAELWLNESSVISGAGALATSLPLPAGNNPLRLRVDMSDDNAFTPPRLLWARPGIEDAPIPAEVLFAPPVTGNGLLGVYRRINTETGETAGGETAGGKPEGGEPLRVAIDQQINTIYHTLPVGRPYQVEWTGKLAVPFDGAWGFTARAIDEVTLEINGEMVVAASGQGVRTEVSLPLAAGLHDIRVHMKATEPFTRVFVEWAPPGQEFVPIPNMALIPPRDSYEDVAMPVLTLPTPPPSEPQPSLPAVASLLTGPLLDTPITVIAEGLAHPVGIAVSEGYVLVADSGAARVFVFDSEGALVREVTGGEQSFVEPFDIAVAPDGTAVLVDAAAPALYRLSADGMTVEPITVAPARADRVRGLGVGSDGTIYLAQTPGQLVVVLNPEGGESDFPIWPGEEAQPVDVAALPNGELYAVSLGIDMIVRYNAQGDRSIAIPVARANAIDAPHLATAPNGDLFVTQPEEGRILWYDASGTIVGHWNLRATLPNAKPVGIAFEALDDGSSRIWFTDVASGAVGWVPAPVLEGAQP